MCWQSCKSKTSCPTHSVWCSAEICPFGNLTRFIKPSEARSTVDSVSWMWALTVTKQKHNRSLSVLPLFSLPAVSLSWQIHRHTIWHKALKENWQWPIKNHLKVNAPKRQSWHFLCAQLSRALRRVTRSNRKTSTKATKTIWRVFPKQVW